LNPHSYSADPEVLNSYEGDFGKWFLRVGQHLAVQESVARQIWDAARSGPNWRKIEDGEPLCKGVHFTRAEASAGGDVCVTAIHGGEFYEYRVKVPPFDSEQFATNDEGRK